MKKLNRSGKNAGSRRRHVLPLVFTVWIVVGMAVAAKFWPRTGDGESSSTNRLVEPDSIRLKEQVSYSARPPGTLTFCKDIAPVVWRRCAACHRPNQSAPFSLLSFRDVAMRSSQIAEVTAKRIMPPWPPEPGHGEFAEARRLTVDELGMLQQWIAEGAIEGDSSELQTMPQWPDRWQLGPPDLVVAMPEPFTLGPEGKDVYHNFVLPIPLDRTNYVKGVEFRPGNPRIVHHAFLYIDRTRQSRRLAAEKSAAGFTGMRVPESARMPEGQFLSWQPGKIPTLNADLAWTLEPGSDLVVQVHLRPSGKPESIQAEAGFYFAERPSTNAPLKIVLTSMSIDIPAGERSYVLTNSFVLPVDAEVIAVLPHAHYLGKELRGVATLPNGRIEPLLLIKDWDFNWQGEYRYAKPVFLPRGTTLAMRYTYDNSAANVRNPHQPPRRVGYGPQSSDEMGELWVQLLVRNQNDKAILTQHNAAAMRAIFEDQANHLLRRDPNDPKAHMMLGKLRLGSGKLAESLQHYHAALRAQPDNAGAHYDIGVVYLRQKNVPAARAAFESALRWNPTDNRAHVNLGVLDLNEGRLAEAAKRFEEALRLNPDDALARENLELISKTR